MEKLPQRSQLLSLPYTVLWLGCTGQGRFMFSRTRWGRHTYKWRGFKEATPGPEPFSPSGPGVASYPSGIRRPRGDRAQLLFCEPLRLADIYRAPAKYSATYRDCEGSEHVCVRPHGWWRGGSCDNGRHCMGIQTPPASSVMPKRSLWPGGA